ncbi:hypothetical protein WJX72_006722 [[Myrmecia] bisecta]|uniref:Major facilitator superfamily (MFS) profile domain-containing protein n=1 Tax=[Myrmecia] bisecta TaxID=41462 RepID=A0AAW1PDC2_9CHLO
MAGANGADDTAHGNNFDPKTAKDFPALNDDDIPNFPVPVDSEHKSKVLKVWTCSAPHHRSFHINWISFFITFLSAYAAAPLVPIIREDIHLTQFQANIAGVVTTSGTVFMRIIMGFVADRFGARYGYAFLLALTSIFVYNMALVTNAATYILMRVLIGFGLASFVVCQAWSSAMFSPNVVGMANAFAGGWGNAGGGFTQIVMPYLTKAFHTAGQPVFLSWRIAFLVPGTIHVIMAMVCLFFGQDLPDGNYNTVLKKAKKAVVPTSVWRSLYVVGTNYRTWLCALCYAYSFGVELALDNALAPYFESNFDFGITKAGNLAAIFGLANFVFRPAGGIFSDIMGRRFGMPGRLWALFITLVIGGLGLVLMGVFHTSYGATIAMMIVTAIGLEATCGTVYGVTPFISRRCNGMACGIVSAGGAVGGVVNQALFFLTAPGHGLYTIQRQNSMKWMGCAVLATAVFGVVPLQWPAWGGMFWGPRKGATEEDYYFSEYTEEERQQGIHLTSSAFAHESRSMRGIKRIRAEANNKLGNAA